MTEHMMEKVDIDVSQIAFWIHSVWMDYETVSRAEVVHARMVLNNDQGLTIGHAFFWGPGKDPIPDSVIELPSPGKSGSLVLHLPVADYEKVQRLFIYKQPVAVRVTDNGRWSFWSGVPHVPSE